MAYEDNLTIDIIKRVGDKGPYVTAKYEYDINKKIVLKLDGSAGKLKKIVMRLEFEGDSGDVVYENIPFECLIDMTRTLQGSTVVKTPSQVVPTIIWNIDCCFSDHVDSSKLSFLYSRLLYIVERMYKNY